MHSLERATSPARHHTSPLAAGRRRCAVWLPHATWPHTGPSPGNSPPPPGTGGQVAAACACASHVLAPAPSPLATTICCLLPCLIWTPLSIRPSLSSQVRSPRPRHPAFRVLRPLTRLPQPAHAVNSSRVDAQAGHPSICALPAPSACARPCSFRCSRALSSLQQLMAVAASQWQALSSAASSTSLQVPAERWLAATPAVLLIRAILSRSCNTQPFRLPSHRKRMTTTVCGRLHYLPSSRAALIFVLINKARFPSPFRTPLVCGVSFPLFVPIPTHEPPSPPLASPHRRQLANPRLRQLASPHRRQLAKPRLRQLASPHRRQLASTMPSIGCRIRAPRLHAAYAADSVSPTPWHRPVDLSGIPPWYPAVDPSEPDLAKAQEVVVDLALHRSIRCQH
ncbi:hypothetical protein HU200_060312 [Digitaria exilis]|uniref:Uncharacterized protein n=1 Tax=Digitaria exilis TaxID=1010633 RepID=A0A835A9H2_9POAL|nr:hypothetical protein HU200_060312 [Digitaria exilis]